MRYCAAWMDMRGEESRGFALAALAKNTTASLASVGEVTNLWPQLSAGDEQCSKVSREEHNFIFYA